MIDRKIKEEEEDRSKRRKSGERRFRIDRDSPPLLIDEHVWGREARTEEQLQWAEARLVNELGFRCLLEDSVVAYQREIDGFMIFADPRQRGTIDFRVVPPIQKSAGGKRTRKSLAPAYSTFKLPDAWKYHLPKKFEELARQHIRTLSPGRAGV